MKQEKEIVLSEKELLENKVKELEFEVERLKQELEKMKRWLVGSKRERFVPLYPDEQLQFDMDIPESKSDDGEKETITFTRKKTKKQKGHGRNEFPAHLPRVDIVIEPDCETEGFKKIGEEITETLEYTPPKYVVNRYIRPKYALPNEEGVAIGSLPSRPIEKGKVEASFLSQVLVDKYIDHIPLYRQHKRLKRLDIHFAVSTLSDLVRQSCELLTPLYDFIKMEMLQSDYLMADETTLPVLDRMKKGKCHLGYLWGMHNPITKWVYFYYKKGRDRAGPNEVLQKFNGYLQTDGYQGYNDITAQKDVISVGCWAHCRRKFYDARSNDKERSEWMLEHIQELYKIEAFAREAKLSFDERYELRQEKSKPVLEEIKEYLDKEVKSILPKSAIGKAFTYALNAWPKLVRYIDDGRIEIDNNWMENKIRPIALGRKNYMFAGSHEGARRAAIIYSLTGTILQYDIEPFTYFKDVLARISDHPYSKINELLPPLWKPIFKE